MAIKIVIDAGHGGKDSGATSGSVYEKTITLSIAKKIEQLLKNCGFSTKMTRSNDVFVELKDRCKIANDYNSKLFLSIHVNSASSADAKGIETLVYSNTGNNAKVASLIQNDLIKATAAKNRGVKSRPDLYVLKGTNMTAVLVETGFISNAAERALLQTESYQNTIARAISRAICSHFGVTYREIKETAAAGGKLYRVQCGAFASYSNAEALAQKINKAGFPTTIVTSNFYKVQCGAFSVRSNAEALAARLIAAGFGAIIV